MMKAEFSDAYMMRNSVLVAIVAIGILTVGGMIYGVVGFVGWAKYVWTNWAAIGTTTLQRHIHGEAPVMYDEPLQRDSL
jgi:hypothetical protein